MVGLGSLNVPPVNSTALIPNKAMDSSTQAMDAFNKGEKESYSYNIPWLLSLIIFIPYELLKYLISALYASPNLINTEPVPTTHSTDIHGLQPLQLITPHVLESVWISEVLQNTDSSCLPPPCMLNDAFALIRTALQNPAQLEAAQSVNKTVHELSLTLYCPIEGGEVRLSCARDHY
jgi:hypothetical protein